LSLSSRGSTADEFVDILVLKFECLRTVEEISSGNWVFFLSSCDARKIERESSCIDRIVQKRIKDRRAHLEYSNHRGMVHRILS
jgi:hypothetical protein